MIKEEYVSFEVAKLLVRKGFTPSNGQHDSYYTLNGEVVYLKDNPREINIAPRYSQAVVMRWLREEHDIFIKLEFDSDEDIQWHPSLTFIKEDRGVHTNMLQWYDSYEEAVEAAIKYCLEYLIK